MPSEIPSVPAVISAARVRDDVEILVVPISSSGRTASYTIGPVAARSLILLLEEALDRLARGDG